MHYFEEEWTLTLKQVGAIDIAIVVYVQVLHQHRLSTEL